VLLVAAGDASQAAVYSDGGLLTIKEDLAQAAGVAALGTLDGTRAETGSQQQRVDKIYPAIERLIWSGRAEEPEESDKHAIGRLHTVNQTEHPMAACLDGSAPGFYIRSAPSTSPNRSKWFLYFQGGGHCNFWRPPASALNCHGRRDSGGGSTLYDPEYRDFSYKEVFSRDPATTLTWHDWNMVFMRYCDGNSFTGAVSDPYVDGDKPPLYFRGVNNVDAMIRTLLERHGMREATDVIAYGCSSGAIGVSANADLMQSLMPRTTFFTVIADSALYPDFSAPDILEGDGHMFVPPDWAAIPKPNSVEKNYFRQGILHMLMQDEFQAPQTFRVSPIWKENVSHLSLQNPGCLNALASKYNSLRAAMYLCGVVNYVAPHVSAPFFLVNSKFDVYAMKKDAVDPSNATVRSGSELDANYYGQQFMGGVHKLVDLKRQHTPSAPFGLLIDSCLHHCEWWGQIKFSENLTNAEEFARWFTSTRNWWASDLASSPAPQLIHMQDASFPCRDCCLTDWNTSMGQWRRIHGARALAR